MRTTAPALNSRKARRWSQMELSFRLGVSQRHVSFVERGRARPSRGLLMAWLHELDAPLAVRNHALLQPRRAPCSRRTCGETVTARLRV